MVFPFPRPAILAGRSLSLSGADTLLGSEASAVSISFLDNSMVVKDTVTPANNFNGLPFNKLSFTRSTTAAYVDSDGLLKFASSGTPRFEYDPVTLSPRGLLVEEQRVNLHLRSQEFDNATWVKVTTNATVTANQAVAPDGTQTADQINCLATTGDNRVTQTIVVANDSLLHTGSMFLKAGNSRYIRVDLRYTGGAPTLNYAYVLDTDTGSVSQVSGGATATAVGATNYGNGWWRVYITGANNSSGNTGLSFGLMGGSNATGTTLVVGYCYAWGSQVEKASFASSYIPTTSASATRNADAVGQLLSTAFEHSALNWSTYIKASTQITAHASDGTARLTHAVSDSTFNESNYFARPLSSTTIGFNNVDGGVGNASISGLTIPAAGTAFKMAMAIKLNDIAGCSNGGAASVDNVCTVPTVNRISIGSNWPGTGNFWCGHIQEFLYVPRRLSNAELQAITT